jgi:hypothetical protein
MSTEENLPMTEREADTEITYVAASRTILELVRIFIETRKIFMFIIFFYQAA